MKICKNMINFQKLYFPMMQNGVNFNPEWPIRVNAEHILSDPENRERLPKKLIRFKNLPLLLEQQWNWADEKQ